MTGSFSVKLKSSRGQFIVKDLQSHTTLADLKARIAAATKVSESQLHILIGFPPRPIDLTQNNETIAAAGISAGETLIVEEKAETQPSIEDDEALARQLQAEEEEEQLRQIVIESARDSNLPLARQQTEMASGSNESFNGLLLKQTVPADNSCLFTSIRFVLKGKVDNEGSELMRHIIAQRVSEDPETYNDAVLGKSNAEYCQWIQRPDSWGGAIEVSILSNYYGIEIDVVDIQNAIINRFGEDQHYGLRGFLLFDGIHYDPLYMESETGDVPATMFPIEAIQVYHQAEQLANEAKSSRMFTNVDGFSLRCLECDTRLVGQAQAQQHAKSTGHQKFDEI